MKKIFVLIIAVTIFLQMACKNATQPQTETETKPVVIAYYSGDAETIKKFPVQKLTHIIFSFLHLKGNKLSFDNAQDSACVRELVRLKEQNKDLKVLIALGGWEGCAPCSDVFNTEAGRKEFAQSVMDILKEYKLDGLDLDWEYPAIPGAPGHTYRPEDKPNFTALCTELRNNFGKDYILTFAAAGFGDYIYKSIEWEKVMPLVDYVNIMTYDLVSGFSKVTGHHTPLHSSLPNQPESAARAVELLDSVGVPKSKMVIGAAFYARVWGEVADINNGLYQAGKFTSYIGFNSYDSVLTAQNGYTVYWDSVAKAPYAYNKAKKLFATFDNKQSVQEKTKFAKEQKLGGIMFWELVTDSYSNGLLDAIWEVR